MDRISVLPDELILKILSFVTTKEAVTSSLLSKRWRSLWKHVGKLDYCERSKDSEHWRASRFIDKFLLLQEAPVLEAMYLILGRNCSTIDIETWIRFAISRGVRDIYFYQHRRIISRPIRLHWSLYTSETLRKLSIILVDVPLTICFRSLKTLDLGAVNFSSDEIVHRFFSGCPVLEELSVIQSIYSDANVKIFTIAVPSLQRLTVMDLKQVSQVPEDDFRFVINAPFLKSLKIANYFHRFCSLVKMPELVKASITLGHSDSKKLLECLTSVKYLFLCLKPSMGSFPTCVFDQLVSLKLCACSLDWCCLILKHTPKLRVLRFEVGKGLLPNRTNLGKCCMSYEDVKTQWEQQPSFAPQCLVSSLETVEWIGYKGTEAEQKLVIYLLENTRQLNTMTIRSSTSIKLEDKLRMLQELASTQRSSKCRLSFT